VISLGDSTDKNLVHRKIMIKVTLPFENVAGEEGAGQYCQRHGQPKDHDDLQDLQEQGHIRSYSLNPVYALREQHDEREADDGQDDIDHIKQNSLPFALQVRPSRTRAMSMSFMPMKGAMIPPTP
jgi:hypothetical protein